MAKDKFIEKLDLMYLEYYENDISKNDLIVGIRRLRDSYIVDIEENKNIITWVPIESSIKPPPCSNVLVRFKKGSTVKSRYFDGDRRFYNINDDIDISNYIEYWALMPK